MWFAALLACSVRLPDPQLEDVEPDRGWNGEETVVTVTGSSFFPQVEIDANRNGSADLDRGYRAWLVGEGQVQHQLTAVAVETYGQLRGVVRPGLAAGLYDLVIEGPTGRSARLDDAFTVSDTRADHLALDAGVVVATVNGQVTVQIELLDPDDQPVLADLEVILEATGENGAITGFFGSGLEGAETLEQGVGVRGFLGSDGRALVPLTIGTPDTVTITAEPADPSTAIQGAEFRQLWQPGDELVVVFDLPQPELVVDAGESFQVGVRLVDQFGNDVTGVSEDVLVQTSCGDFIRNWTLTGQDTFTVTPTRATDFNNCAQQVLRVLPGGLQGQSEPFDVRAGPAETFDVTPVFAERRAGEEIIALITARDGFDNRTAFPTGLALSDSVGGLGPASCEVTLNGIDRNCQAQTTIAGEQVQLIATAGAVNGTSSAYTVLPALQPQRLVLGAPSQVVAGEVTLVTLSLFDPWNNQIDASELDLSELQLGMDNGARAPCGLQGTQPSGAAEYVCTFLEAQAERYLTAVLDGALAQSDPFEVVNGPVGLVEIATPPEVVAGEPFHVGLAAFDAHGNPYRAQVPGAVRLSQEELGLVSVDFDPHGTADLVLSLTLAGSTVFEAIDLTDAVIGTSDPLEVRAAPSSTLEVQVDRPWLFLGETATVTFQAIDVYGNLGTESEQVTVYSDRGASPVVDAELAEGTGSAQLSWDALALDDRVHVVAHGLAGVSERVDVVGDCGVFGPTVSVDFAGAPTGRACVPPGPSPVALSFAGSTAGDAPLALYRAQVAGLDALSSPTPAFNVEVEQLGRNPVAVLAIDAVGCGAESEVAIWAGPDDGLPVGPLVTAVAQDPINLGGSVEVDVIGAVDCTGDPSTGTLRVRSDRGQVLGTTPSGEGLNLQLDASGSGTVTLETLDETTGGLATLVFESASGGARAVPQIEIVGDDQPPVVWGQSPIGDTEGEVDSLVLDFSEPLLTSTVDPTNFVVQGTTSIPVHAVSLVTPTRVELFLEAPVDAGVELRALVATSQLRDLAGNRLDGALVGGPSSWSGSFGPAPNVFGAVDCVADVDVFRPDGDPGVGSEADEVELDVSLATQPAIWRLAIDDQDGELLEVLRVVATGTQGVLVWTGEDATGRVVDDGVYTLRATAEDAAGNRAAPCVRTVTIDNERSLP